MFHFAALLTLLGLLACKAETPASEMVSATAEAVPAGFVAFYERFHADSLYQVEHIAWPLSGKRLQEGEVAGEAGAGRWTRDTWRVHKRVRPEDGFVLEYEVMGDDLVTERIAARQGNYELIRRFARLSDGWQLIYYAESAL